MTVYGAAGGASVNASFDRNQNSAWETTHNNSLLLADNIDITTSGDTIEAEWRRKACYTTTRHTKYTLTDQNTYRQPHTETQHEAHDSHSISHSPVIRMQQHSSQPRHHNRAPFHACCGTHSPASTAL
jgi:hypothetical protein